MKIAIPTETQAGESRVAASPDTVKNYIKKGAEVWVQSGAGRGASISDDAFAAAGAKIATGGFTDPAFGTFCAVANQYSCSTCPAACNAMCAYNPLSLRNCSGAEAAQP